MPEVKKLFRVVGRTRASCLIKAKENLLLSVNTTSNPEPVEFNFQTHFLDRGYETLVPEGLWVEVCGTAPDLKGAIDQYINKANDLAAILSVSVNAYIPPIEAELAYDDTPGTVEHEYFQSFIKEDQATVVANRTLDCELSIKFFDAIAKSTHVNRLLRAIGQYSAALGHWKPGTEMMCVAHCFMGLEALKPVALEHYKSKTGLSSEDLARQWGYNPTGRQKISEFLDVQARERLLFNGDQECRKKAKKVSDDFEHGFSNFSQLHPIAREIIVPTATYLRNSILTLSGMEENDAKALIDGYEHPKGPLKIIKYIWGTMHGNGGELAEEGQAYPYFQWQSKLVRVWLNEKEKYTTTHDDNMKAVLGKGIRFSPKTPEIWDGSILRREK
jgi:hypothetical protein